MKHLFLLISGCSAVSLDTFRSILQTRAGEWHDADDGAQLLGARESSIRPYLLCDATPTRPGMHCMETLRGLTNHALTPAINKANLTCAVGLLDEQVVAPLPGYVSTTLLTPAMKLALPVPDATLAHASYCDEVSEPEVPYIHCNDAKMVRSSSSEIVYQSHHCIEEIAWALARLDTVCFVSTHRPLQLWNSEATSIGQGGRPNHRPFREAGLNGTDQIIAVSDTGLDTDHCFFNETKIVQYRDRADDVDLKYGHGTHVAGTALGKTGMAPAAALAFYDFGRDGTLISVSTWDQLFPGYTVGARVHSASWGQNDNRYLFSDKEMDSFMFRYPKMLIVVAAGNEGSDPHTVASPGIAKNILSVGASTKNGKIATFSSRGPTADLRRKPDMVAPGVDTISAGALPDQAGECDTVSKQGTSMAAPLVAGAVAIVQQYFKQGWWATNGRSPDERNGYSPHASLIKAILLNGAQELDSQAGNGGPTIAYDIHQGFGQLDLSASLPLGNDLSVILVNSVALSHGESRYYSVIPNDQCQQEYPLSVTLVWTDPPTATLCLQCVLNDLDLTVTIDGSHSVYANGLDHPDEVNNAERIRLKNPVVGAEYIIQVHAKELIGHHQPFSLVISGCFDEHTGNEHVLGDCNEGDAKFYVSGRQVADCQWLRRNYDEWSHLCDTVHFAGLCPSTCNKCKPEHQFLYMGSEQSPIRWYGVVIPLEMHETMYLQGIHVTLAGDEYYHLEIYLVDQQGDQILLFDSYAIGKGPDEAILVSGEGFGVPLLANQSYELYVTCDEPDLLLTAATTAFNTTMVSFRPGFSITQGLVDQGNSYTLHGSLLYTAEGCMDNRLAIEVDGKMRDCAWLSTHLEVYGHMCSWYRIASVCQETCGTC